MKLNLGAGNDIREGWVNVDAFPVDDRVTPMDIEKSWPANWVDLKVVLLRDVVEHLKDPNRVIMAAAVRLCPAGEVIIRGPHFTCRDTHTDFTHHRGLSSESVPHSLGHLFAVYVHISFEWWNRWMHWVNWIPCGLKIYESTFLCSLAPAKYVHARIRRR